MSTEALIEKIELVEKVEKLAEEYEQDPLLALQIMHCESGLNPEAVNLNKTKDGEVWSSDRGRFQINDYFHHDTALALGLDIHDSDDNLEYGFHLLREQGTRPWSASEPCWRIDSNE